MDEALHYKSSVVGARFIAPRLPTSVRHRSVDRSLTDLKLPLKAGAGKRPGTLNETQTLFTFILTLFLKGNSYDIHFTLVLFCK